MKEWQRSHCIRVYMIYPFRGRMSYETKVFSFSVLFSKILLHSNPHPKGATTAFCVSQLIPPVNDECRRLAREAQVGGFNR